MEEKFCLRCQRMKPTDDFGPSSTTPDRKQSWCRECINLYARLNVEHKAVGGVKYCRECHGIKPKTEFYPCASHIDGLQTKCKECDKEHGKLKRADGYLKEANTVLTSYPTEELIAELRKRGYEGELRITKTVKI